METQVRNYKITNPCDELKEITVISNLKPEMVSYKHNGNVYLFFIKKGEAFFKWKYKIVTQPVYSKN